MEALPALWAAHAPPAGTLVLCCLAVAVAGVLRGLTGFGFALAAVPLLSMFLVPAQANYADPLRVGVEGLRAA